MFFSSEKEKIKTIAGGFKHFLIFTPNPGEDEPIFVEHIFQMGWFNHQPENVSQFPVFRTLGSVVIDPVPIPSLGPSLLGSRYQGLRPVSMIMAVLKRWKKPQIVSLAEEFPDHISGSGPGRSK